MPRSQEYDNLFRHSDAADKLSLLQALLDSKDLTSVQAIALLNNIRAELETPQTNRSSVYRRYAQVMESLRREMPEVHEEVVHTWEAKRRTLQAQAQPTGDLMGLQSAPGQESAIENLFESPTRYRQPLENLSEHIQEKADLPESKEEPTAGLQEGFEEGETEHEELEEEREEHESKEQLESEQEKEDQELEEKGEDNKFEEQEDREGQNGTNEEAEAEARDTEEQEEGKGEIEELDENEEVEVEKAEFEPGEESQSGAEESSENGETEAEVGEEAKGGDRMAAEAAEAAAHMESESGEVEVPGEEEPPIEAGE